jgi:hypothetical protein
LERILALRNRIDYDRAVAVVRSVINTWDPYRVVSSGGPLDEWESEVASLVTEIPRISSAQDAAQAVARTFSRALGANGFSAQDCEAVGTKLFEELVNAGILEPTASPAA